MAKGGRKIPSDVKAFMRELIREVLSEEKADRCLRIARQKYDKPSAYRSGAIVRCRKGDIWKDLKEGYVLSNLEDEYGVKLDVYLYKDGIKLDRIIIPKDKRKQGIGSKVMGKVIQYADREQKPIYLTPSKDFGASSIERLEKFYKKFGFIKKPKSDFSTKETMVRYPITNLKENQNLDQLPKGKIFDDAKNIEGIFQKSKRSWNEVIEAYEKYKEHQQPTTINIQDIKITQPNIQANKVKNMLDKIDKLPPINVVEFENGEKVVFDAHHRLVANWVLGRDKIKVNLVKIKSPKDKIKQAIQELLQEDESLHKWFSRRGAKGKSKGWVDCNAPDGKGGYKSCGRQEGEKRSKYPACRPTPASCKDKGKGKTWGKTK